MSSVGQAGAELDFLSVSAGRLERFIDLAMKRRDRETVVPMECLVSEMDAILEVLTIQRDRMAKMKAHQPNPNCEVA
ncbi:MAG: hypothetical protein AAGK02_07250 [Pseudomonadota bacterium]